MKFPIVISINNTLVIANPDFFHLIGRLDPENSYLEVNVASNGKAGIQWILDANGKLFDLKFVKILAHGFLRTFGLRRFREQFEIMPGRRGTVGELKARTKMLKNQFEEAPNVTDFVKMLSFFPDDYVLRPEDIRKYLCI